MILLLYISLALVLSASVVALYFIITSFYTLLNNTHVPFVPAPTHALRPLINALDLNEQSTVYDLGCGDGKILRACYAQAPQAHYVGIEKAFVPWILAQIKNHAIPATHMSIVRKSFLTSDISSATHIVLYLFPFMMDKLLPKFERECRPGTRIISIDFPFSHKEPTHIIPLSPHHTLGKKLFVYEL